MPTNGRKSEARPIDTSVKCDTTVYAKWLGDEYTITYDLDGNLQMPRLNSFHGESLCLIAEIAFVKCIAQADFTENIFAGTEEESEVGIH